MTVLCTVDENSLTEIYIFYSVTVTTITCVYYVCIAIKRRVIDYCGCKYVNFCSGSGEMPDARGFLARLPPFSEDKFGIAAETENHFGKYIFLLEVNEMLSILKQTIHFVDSALY